MAGIQVVTARGVPLDSANVDTDSIIPARFLKQRRGPAYKEFLFHERRFAPDGRKIAGFPIDDPAYAGARILCADANFGIGSAREGAVWALKEFGFAAIVASSFGDTFRENCVKNGVVPVLIAPDPLRALRRQLRISPGTKLTIDVDAGSLAVDGALLTPFPMDLFERRLLTGNVDVIGLTPGYLSTIQDFERRFGPPPVR
jgi:3-isopropylmalate/(R)-2-methylmalate dehydratase small subunit